MVPHTHSQLINVQKHLIYVSYGFVKQSKWGLRSIFDDTKVGSLPPKLPKIHPTFMWGSIRLRVVPYTHLQLIKVVTTFDMYDMDL